MIEETDYQGAQLYPQRVRNQLGSKNSSIGNENFLREAFSSQAYYDEFYMLMAQLLQQNVSSSKPNSLFEKPESSDSKIIERIGLDGKVKKSTYQQGINYRQTSNDIKVTLKLFQEALKNKGSLQQRRQYLRSVICQEFSKTAKTYLDFKKYPTTKSQMYKNQFPNSGADIDLSLTSLEKEFSNKARESRYDYILDMRLLKICFGHDDGENEMEPGTSIYNIAFDKSNKLLFSADQMGLIKVWSKQTGLLLTSFKGHSSYIEQIYISEDNKYLVSSGLQGIRVWSLFTFECVAIYHYENSVVTSNSYYSPQTGLILFISDSKYLYLIDENTINKANGKAVPLNTIVTKIQLPKNEDRTVVQISVNVNGYCLISFDNGKIYLIDKEFLTIPESYKFIQINQHWKKNLELSWSKSGQGFISGSMDGTCRIFDFNPTCFLEGKLTSVAHLKMARHDRKRRQKEIICNSVSWTCQNNYILACFSEINKQDEEQKLEAQIIVYDYRNKKILHEIRNKLFYKLESVNIIEPHPVVEQIALFCESNGRIVLFNILKCQMINVFHERCFHNDYPHLFIQPIEAKFSTDGSLIAVSTEYGNITLYGSGSKSMYFHCPTQQFFMTDKELFILDSDMLPLSASADIDINLLNKYPMCNVRNNPYDFQYSNNLEQLAKNNFFSEQMVAVPISSDPYKTDQAWEQIIEKQTLENLSRQEALKSFYVSTEAGSNQELALQQNYVMTQYKDVLNNALMEFNNISETLSKPQIKIVEPRRRLTRNKLRKSKNAEADSDQSGDSRMESVGSYIQQENYQQSESEISYHSQSQNFVNLRRNPRRRRIFDQSDDSVVENARKPPAQRIQELDEIYDRMQERQNRIRTRQLGAQGNTHSGNRRRQQHSQSQEPAINQLCARCTKSFSEDVETCSSCHTVYCKECKKLRGVEDQYGYTCLNCLFLKKGRQLEKNVVRKYFGQTSRSSQFFMPQIDDQVYFFYPGYQQVLTKYHEAFNPEAAHIFEQFQLLAIDALEELKTAPLCRVTDMEYLFPVRPRARQNFGRRQPVNQDKVKEILIVVELLTQKGLTFQVFYIPGYVEFLVRKELVDYAMNNQKDTIKKLQENSIQIIRGEEQVQIVRVKPIQGKNILSLWKSIEVIPHEQGTRRLRRDLQKENISIWDITSKVSKIPYITLSAQEEQKIILSIDVVKTLHGQFFKFFEENVNLQEYPLYLKSVQVPMCINTIVSRVKQNYYTSIKSVIFDLRLIPRASSSFSGAEHDVTQAAEILVSQIINMITGDDQEILQKLNVPPIVNQSMMVEEEPQDREEDKQQPIVEQPIIVNLPRPVVPQIEPQPQVFSRRSLNSHVQSRYQASQTSSVSQHYEAEVEVESNQRNRQQRATGRNTRANPETQLTRSNRQTRSRRINYREMEVEYRSQTPENPSNIPARRSTRHRL